MATALKNVGRLSPMGTILMHSTRRFAHGGGAKLEKINANLPEYTRKFKELQHVFQKDESVPVHLKLGARDKAVYYLTWTLIAVGLVESGRFYYKLLYK